MLRSLILPAVLFPCGAFAQIAVTNETTGSVLADAIKGDGIQSFSNITVTALSSTGTTKGSTSSSAGLFSGGTGIVGLGNGIVLSTGGIFNVVGPNTSNGISLGTGTGGDADLGLVIGRPTNEIYDKTILEFDFVPVHSTIAFRYVFSSEEYHEYANSSFNDVFAFFVNGNAPANNIALIPGTMSPVSINNVNGGNPLGTNPQNAQFFVSNSPAVYNVEMDGFTTVLTAQATVTPGVLNHIKIAIADAGDGSLDSNVFIQAASFVAGNAPVAVNDGYQTLVDNALSVIPGGVLANDTDADNNLQRALLVSPPANGTVVLNPNGGFDYTPNTGFAGFDTFTYIAIDATNIQSPPATVSIHVTPGNTVPTSSNNSLTVSQDSNSTVPLSVFPFVDPDAGASVAAVKLTGFTLPIGATLQLNGVDVTAGQVISAVDLSNDKLKFAAAPGQSGSPYATVNFEVSDGIAFSAGQTLTINVSTQAADIVITGNSITINNGDATPDTADGTVVGTAVVAGGSSSTTFTISNPGNSPLTLGTPTITGPAATNFTVIVPPAAVVAPGDTTLITVQFDPSAAGLRSATLNVPNSVASKSPYSFALEGTGIVLAPEIAVQDSLGVFLVDGASNIDFSSVFIGSSSAPKTLTIKNTGNSTLTLTGVTQDGAASGDFSVTAPGSNTIAPNATTTFTVTFAPTAAGARTAAIHIANDDPDEESFDITVTGTGVVVNTAPVATGDSFSTPYETAHTGTLSATDVDNTPNTSGLTYSVTTPAANGNVVLTDTATGAYTYTPNPGFSGSDSFSFKANDGTADSNIATVNVTVGPQPVPEIVVENSLEANVADGATHDFGAVILEEAAFATFTVRNTGTAPLTGLAITFDGANASDFSVTTAPTAPVAPAGLTTFTVRFAPGATGARTAVLHIANNDSDEAPFDITLTGEGSPIPLVDDAITTTTGDARLYPLANDPNGDVTITSVSEPGVTISADGRHLIVPASVTAAFTYTTSEGKTGNIGVNAGTIINSPARWYGLLYDSTGAVAGRVQGKTSGTAYTLSVKVGSIAKNAILSNGGTVGTAVGTVTMTRDLANHLQVSVDTGSGILTGDIRVARTSAVRSTYNAVMTALDAGFPGGSYMTVTLLPSGTARFFGKLPDGKDFGGSSLVADNGTFAVFSHVRLTNPRGYVGGELTAAALPATDITGELGWARPAQSSGIHSGAVDTTLLVNGSRYLSSAPLPFGTLEMTLTGGNFSSPVVETITYNAASVSGTGVVKGLTITQSSGRIKGVMTDPVTNRDVYFNGLYIPKAGFALGFFKGSSTGGRIEIELQ